MEAAWRVLLARAVVRAEMFAASMAPLLAVAIEEDFDHPASSGSMRQLRANAVRKIQIQALLPEHILVAHT